MIVTPLKTPRIEADQNVLLEVINAAIEAHGGLTDGSVLVVTSKIVSLCEGSVVPSSATTKSDLVTKQSEWYMPRSASRYGMQFTITDSSLIPSAGIDESNGGDYYVLWPQDAQATANMIRQHLRDRYSLRDVGVLISDSTCRPMRRGTTGISIASSGFKPLREYVETPDLFGRPFAMSQADVAGGLAAAAVLAMGEGAEQTPLCVVSDMPFVTFCDNDPTADELHYMRLTKDEDLFEPFLNSVQWTAGEHDTAS